MNSAVWKSDIKKRVACLILKHIRYYEMHDIALEIITWKCSRRLFCHMHKHGTPIRKTLRLTSNREQRAPPGMTSCAPNVSCFNNQFMFCTKLKICKLQILDYLVALNNCCSSIVGCQEASSNSKLSCTRSVARGRTTR